MDQEELMDQLYRAAMEIAPPIDIRSPFSTGLDDNNDAIGEDTMITGAFI